jgi:hypothetical protein
VDEIAEEVSAGNLIPKMTLVSRVLHCKCQLFLWLGRYVQMKFLVIENILFSCRMLELALALSLPEMREFFSHLGCLQRSRLVEERMSNGFGFGHMLNKYICKNNVKAHICRLVLCLLGIIYCSCKGGFKEE